MLLFYHIKAILFADDKIRYMGIYFPRCFITTAKHVLMVEAVEYREKYMNICLIILMWEKTICEKSILIYYIQMFYKKVTKF